MCESVPVHLLNKRSIPGSVKEMGVVFEAGPLDADQDRHVYVHGGCWWRRGVVGSMNLHQTIYYNDRKQEVQPLHSHMAASCVGNQKKEDREDDRKG